PPEKKNSASGRNRTCKLARSLYRRQGSPPAQRMRFGAVQVARADKQGDDYHSSRFPDTGTQPELFVCPRSWARSPSALNGISTRGLHLDRLASTPGCSTRACQSPKQDLNLRSPAPQAGAFNQATLLGEFGDHASRGGRERFWRSPVELQAQRWTRRESNPH